jgi:hypothetical protein
VIVLGVATLLLLSVLERARRSEGGGSLEAIVLGSTFALVLVGLAGTLLATFGIFDVVTVAIACASMAAMLWPWGRPRPPVRVHAVARRLAIPLALAGGATLLRWPPMDYALAGRDQGTYLLRAEQLVRTGRFDDVDRVLARASEDAASRSGPADLLGLVARRDEPAHQDLYEGPYRPGWYLADRERGRIVPQFMHVHPVLLATAMLAVGRPGAIALPVAISVLGVLAVFAVARRLWRGGGPWPAIAAGLFAVSPIAVWVGRTSLSEVPAMLVGWAAVLAMLRAPQARARSDALELAAFFLGAAAWIRGNAWLAAPVVLAALWLVPSDVPRRWRAPLVYLALLVGAVLVHATTVFPYLHDELVRQLDLGRTVTPTALAGAAVVGALAWLVLDRVRAPSVGDRVRALVPALLGGAVLLAIASYVRDAAQGGPPFSRLDPALPLVGAPLLVAAAVGSALALSRAPTRSAADTWLLAAAATVPVTLSLYAQRNLPQAGLYYYGRYLVPELLPVACLTATLAIARLDRWVRARSGRRAVAFAVTATAVVALAWPVRAFLVQPTTRLREFDGADRAIQWLAARIPTDAIVIAGGEGWHHGHTFNQVGGALAMGRGRTVLPYRTREAAYATLYELAIARPRAHGEPPPALFLLVNEATDALAVDASEAAAQRGVVAAFDDLLPPPFRARRVDLLELLVHRLTPTTDAIPARVTRDVLRMALVEIEVDAPAAASIEHRAFEPVCLHPDRDTDIALAPGPLRGAISLAIVAAPGTASHNDAWTVRIDGDQRGTRVAGTAPRWRDTLGPFVLDERPRSIAVRGAAHAVAGAACPHGGVQELRLAPIDRPALAQAEVIDAITFAPPQELGHPVRPLRWVAGRGLSRYRAGIEPRPQIRAVSMVLDAARPLAFAPEPLPAGDELDLVVTLTGATVSPEARLVVDADGIEIAEIDPPDAREGSWQSAAIRWRPTRALAAFTLRLRGAGPGESVLVRDIGLFSRGEAIASTIAAP